VFETNKLEKKSLEVHYIGLH